MKILTKYLKPYIIILPLCFVMLFGQAICDLSLPNLMSNIVNVGIQQQGINDTAPDAISENGFRLASVFMTSEQKKLVNENYEFIQTGVENRNYNKYVKRYPELQTKSIYVQKLKKDTKIEEINNCFKESYAVMLAFCKDYAKNSYDAYLFSNDNSEIDINKFYQVLPVFEQYPNSSFENARNEALQMDDYIKTQFATMVTGQTYKELGIDLLSLQKNYILRVGIYMLIITLASAVISIIVSFLSARISCGMVKNIRKDIFKKVESFSNNELDKFSTASLITRTTNDTTQIQSTVMIGIKRLCYAPIMCIGGIIMAINKSLYMSWLIALVIIVLIGFIMIIYSVAVPQFKKMQRFIDKLNLIVREHLNGLLVIRAFGTQKFEEKRFTSANKDVTKVSLFTGRVMAFMMPAMMFFMNIICVLIIFVGAHQIASSKMQVGDMMAFMQYAMQIIISFLIVSIMFIWIPRASVSANRIAEVLNTTTVINDKKDFISLKKNYKCKVSFKNVYFKYEGAHDYALKNINFDCLPGQTTAIVGSTGAGKTTLVNLIPRFYDTTKGDVLINGINVKDISQHELRENIGLVSQKAILFSGNVKSNLQLGKSDATNDEIEEALEIAQAKSFVQDKKDGIYSNISQNGDNISGGQKQRLAIARALVKKAKIYIFDDGFSALDFKTDADLRKALKEKTKDSTVLIVAQRISTIMDADQIIVLDKGSIVGIGTHDELMKNCKQYKEIAASQL